MFEALGNLGDFIGGIRQNTLALQTASRQAISSGYRESNRLRLGFVTEQVDTAYVYAGWAFFGFRALHSAVHCTFNLVMLRFTLYAVSSLMVWFMIIRAALGYFGS